MVRKKTTITKSPSVFAPPGKVMMIEKNRLSNTPLKTPKSSRTPLLKSLNDTHNKTNNSTILKTPGRTKKKKVNQTLKAIREIKKFQKITCLLIPKAPFSRVVREITQNVYGKDDIRFSALSLAALQEAAEMAIVNLLEIANLCCIHAKRVTLSPADIRLTRRAFGLTNALNQ